MQVTVGSASKQMIASRIENRSVAIKHRNFCARRSSTRSNVAVPSKSPGFNKDNEDTNHVEEFVIESEDLEFTVTPQNEYFDDREPGEPGEIVCDSASTLRKTKIVCTVGPASCNQETFSELTKLGMNVVALDAGEDTYEVHKAALDLVRAHNRRDNTESLAVMVNLKGPEVRSSELSTPLALMGGEELLIIQSSDENTHSQGACVLPVDCPEFIANLEVGDEIIVDSGTISLRVRAPEGPEGQVRCEVLDGGELSPSSAGLTLFVRGKVPALENITEQDWLDVNHGMEQGVDYFSLPMVRDEGCIHALRRHLQVKGCQAQILAKVETASCIRHLDAVLHAADGAIVARGNLGAEMPLGELPLLQSTVVSRCNALGKPVIIAGNMLDSMVISATPSRAEVSDIAVSVREGTDAVMLSEETAWGLHPAKALATLAQVCDRTERALASKRIALRFSQPLVYSRTLSTPLRNRRASAIAPSMRGDNVAELTATSELFAHHACNIADGLFCPLVVFTRSGTMAALLSHYRPDLPVYAFCDREEVARRLSLVSGVRALFVPFDDDAESTFQRALIKLRDGGHVFAGQNVTLVQSGRQKIWRQESTHTISVREVPQDGADFTDGTDSFM